MKRKTAVENVEKATVFPSFSTKIRVRNGIFRSSQKAVCTDINIRLKNTHNPLQKRIAA